LAVTSKIFNMPDEEQLMTTAIEAGGSVDVPIVLALLAR
jgi:hypothetical protein